MTDAFEITSEMIAEYQHRQQVQEQAAMQQCINDLMRLAAERGFTIVAIPQIEQGRIVAVWGVQRK